MADSRTAAEVIAGVLAPHLGTEQASAFAKAALEEIGASGFVVAARGDVTAMPETPEARHDPKFCVLCLSGQHVRPEIPETARAQIPPCRCGHTVDDHDAGECWAETDGDRCTCVWYEPETAPAVKESLKAARDDVPDDLARLGYRAWSENSSSRPGSWSAEQQVRAIVAAVLPAARRQWFAELFGTPEEIRQREIEAKANAKPDDPAELCERARPGHHEQRVRAKVAEEARAYAEGHLPVVRAVLYAFSSRITIRGEQP